MSVPERWEHFLKLPVIVAPMFLGSYPDLVVATCRRGIVGTFPALNQRTTNGYRESLRNIRSRLPESTPFGVNLIAHHSNERLEADLSATVDEKVPLVITSLGAAAHVVDAVNSYGGLVFHDVTSVRHAEKAVEAGVDGIIAVCAGAGGHGGTLSPFALVPEIRRIFDGTIVLAGAVGTGAHVAAAEALGADMAYMGTRFLATEESGIPDAHKQMIVESAAADILYTDKFSVSNANYLRQSIIACGFDPDNIPQLPPKRSAAGVRVWKDIWSAGQGVGGVSSIQPVAELCDELEREYHNTRDRLTAGAPPWKGSAPNREKINASGT